MQQLPRYLLSVLLFLSLPAFCQEYRVQYSSADTASEALLQTLPRKFKHQAEAATFINTITSSLQAKGFVGAAVDSVRYDSAGALVVLYFGPRYQWTSLRTAAKDAALLEAIRWPQGGLAGKQVDFLQVQSLQERVLDYLENTGHPFGRVFWTVFN